MSALRVLLPIALVLAACGGDSGDTDMAGDTAADTDAVDDANTVPSTDTTDDASDDTSTATPPVGSVLFQGWVTNGVTQEPVEGAELCVLEPEQEGEPCGTTDADGLVEWTWLAPVESNFTARFEGEGYMPLLFLGHYDDEVAASWEQDGVISVIYRVYLTTVMEWWLGEGAITMDSDAGHIFVVVVGATEGTALDGMTASLSDGSGAVVYWGADGTTLNSELSASSTAGSIVIGNVAPGTHTVNIAHGSLVCDNARAWLSDASNTYTVPVEAGTITVIYVRCGIE